MIERQPSNRRVRVAKRTEFILLVLKQIRIDGAGANAEPLLQIAQFSHISYAIRQVPQYMQRNRRRDAHDYD